MDDLIGKGIAKKRIIDVGILQKKYNAYGTYTEGGKKLTQIARKIRKVMRRNKRKTSATHTRIIYTKAKLRTILMRKRNVQESTTEECSKM